MYRKRLPVEDRVAFISSNHLNDGVFHFPVRLQAVLFRLKMGQTLPEIKRDLPEISTSRLLHARAYFAAQYPKEYKPHFEDGFKILIDENLDPHFTTDGARRAFGEAVHVSFVDLDTKTDLDVWRYACANEFNMIVTKDRAEVEGRKHLDLTRCATLKWKWRMQVNGGKVDWYLRQLPRILHIKDADIHGKEVAARLQDHKETIEEIFEEPISPIIEVHKKSVSPGENFIDILQGKTCEILERHISRHTDRLISELGIDTSGLDGLAHKKMRHRARNIVTLEMGGDYTKIPFSGSRKRQELINSTIANIFLEVLEATQERARNQSSYGDFVRALEKGSPTNAPHPVAA